MGTRQRFAIPDGWVARGFRFEVQPTTSEQPGRIAQSFGGRRFAYNWALGQVKAEPRRPRRGPGCPAAGVGLLRAPPGVEPGQ